MSQALYALYQKRVFDLAQTMVVKHSEVATAMNEGIALANGGLHTEDQFDTTNPADPRTWKYYQNLAGEYHSYDTWKLLQTTGYNKMRIKVAGDSGPVDADLTWQLLASDPALANAYAYGTSFYKDLVDKYPDFHDLIDCIINPIDIDVAIAADDGDILYAGGYYNQTIDGRKVFVSKTLAGRRPPNLVEENETNLLPKLQQWIKNFLFRWHVPDYMLSDELYLATMIGVLYAQIPKLIMNYRLENCHTMFAHSYHVNEYLASNGKLDVNVDMLAKREQLWVYRNLRYLEKNVGKRETMDLLVNHLATPSGIPLTGYDLRHDLAKMNDNLSFDPDVKITREIINFQTTDLGNATRTVREILNKEAPHYREGFRDLDEVESDTISLFRYRSASGNLMTKVVESDLIDLTDSKAFPLADTLLNLWIYKAANGTFTGNIFVTNPLSGDRIILSPKQAAIVFFYAINRAWAGLDLEYIPSIGTNNIPREEFSLGANYPARPTLATLDTAAEGWERYLPTDYNSTLEAEWFPSESVYGVNEFYRYAQRVNELQMQRYTRYIQIEDMRGRAMGEWLASQFYWDVCYSDLGDTTLYATWLYENGFDFSGFDVSEFEKLALDILKQSTGVGEGATNKMLSDRQAAVMAILRYLSSYAVQYIYSIRDGGVIQTAGAALRTCNEAALEKMRFYSEFSRVSAMDTHFVEHMRVDLELGGTALAEDIRMHESMKVMLPTNFPHPTIRDYERGHLKVSLSSVSVLERSVTDVPLQLKVGDNILDGFGYPVDTTIGASIPTNTLNGFDYPV